MNTNYYTKNMINPSFGFNKLSVGNPFNDYKYEDSKNSFSQQDYSAFTHNVKNTLIHKNLGIKVNPEQHPMTNYYNLKTKKVQKEQKYNPYFSTDIYPQWNDRVKDLMNYTYNEVNSPIYNDINDTNNDNYNLYSQNNINIDNAPQSSRVPKVDDNIYSSLVTQNFHFIGNHKNNSNQSDDYNNLNYTNEINNLEEELSQNQIINQNDGLQSNNQNINYIQNLSNNTYNEIISDNNAKEYYKESKSGLVQNYAYCEEDNLIHREYMEDQGLAIENFNNDPNKILFALFDGHGGSEVSKFLQENLPINMKKMLSFSDHFDGFEELFRTLDEQIKELNCPDVGSTATIALIERQNGKKYLYCINVGDSKCIIINKKGTMVLSRDDRVDNPSEKERIIKEGGVIYNGRVYGTLMLSRSLGDWSIKRYGVSNVPHMSRIEINENDLFLVIASDGVWDYMKEDDFRVLMNTNINSFDVCKDIVTQSLRNGSSDNISCFVIKL